MVVGCIVQHQGRLLLCRRGIEPQRGLWTVPAGYLECGESSAEGAAREALEEAGAHVTLDAPYCIFDIPAISQVRNNRFSRVAHWWWWWRWRARGVGVWVWMSRVPAHQPGLSGCCAVGLGWEWLLRVVLCS